PAPGHSAGSPSIASTAPMPSPVAHRWCRHCRRPASSPPHGGCGCAPTGVPVPEGDVLARVARRLTLALGTGPLVRTELRWPDLGGADLTGQRVRECVSYGKHLFLRT